MAHRSDRRGGTPITALAFEVVQAIGTPRADFHDGPEPKRLHREAEDTTAVRLFARPSGYEKQPRRSARVKALRPPLGGALRAALTVNPRRAPSLRLRPIIWRLIS